MAACALAFLRASWRGINAGSSASQLANSNCVARRARSWTSSGLGAGPLWRTVLPPEFCTKGRPAGTLAGVATDTLRTFSGCWNLCACGNRWRTTPTDHIEPPLRHLDGLSSTASHRRLAWKRTRDHIESNSLSQNGPKSKVQPSRVPQGMEGENKWSFLGFGPSFVNLGGLAP